MIFMSCRNLYSCILPGRFIFLAGLAAAIFVHPVRGWEPNRLTASEQAEGFELLFDGATTTGWLEITGDPFPHQSWKIEDGALKPIAGLIGFQDIRTVGDYRDFDFRFEWKVAKGANSGVKYLLEKVDRWVPKTAPKDLPKDQTPYHARARGFEYQIVDDALNSEARADPKNTSGALYGKLAPLRAVSRPVGEWNEGRIVVRGGHVEQWLNGVKVVECECAAAYSEKRTPISLQNHDSDAWFRTLRVKRL